MCETEENQTFLKLVSLDSDVYMVCLQHALTTEKEEVMGLLIGEVDVEEKISQVLYVMILRRIDKQPDRVEISPEDICKATSYAESISKKMNRSLRVVGWYHSHPHITVWPSHVDVRTQGMYQMMDSFFVGLIFSVYHNDTGSFTNHVQVISFQSIKTGTEYNRREIDLIVRPSAIRMHNLEAIIKLPKVLFDEEVNSHDTETKGCEDDLIILHNKSIKIIEMIQILTKVAKPLCFDMEVRLNTTRLRIQHLKKLKKELLREIN